MALTWTIGIDWQDIGTFTDESSRAVMPFRVRRGRERMVKASGKGFEIQRIGTLTLTFQNQDRRFDPFYASSALYPNVFPGHDVKVQVNDGSSTYDVFRGKIDAIAPGGNASQPTVTVTVLDGWNVLNTNQQRIATQTDILTGTAIGDVLTAVGYPWTSSLDAGNDTIPYWWLANANADDAIRALTDSELGIFYIAANGAATFIQRTNTYNPTALATIDQAQLLKDGSVEMPWDNVRNVADVTVHPYATNGNLLLWSLNQPTLIPAGQTLTLYANLTLNNVPAVLLPISGSYNAEYAIAVNTSADGSGTYLSPDVTITPYGTTVQFLVTDTGGAAFSVPVYVTSFQVTGPSATAPDSQFVEYDNSVGSQYGRRVLALDLPWQQDTPRALNFAQYLVHLLSGENLASNPSFETDLSGWSTVGTFATNTRDSGQAKFGTWSNKLINSSGSTASRYTTFTAKTAITTISIWMYRTSGSANVNLILQENFGSFSLINSATFNTTTGTWQRLTISGATTVGSVYRLRVECLSGNTIYIDGAWIASQLQNATPVVKLENRWAQQFGYDLSNVIRYTAAYWGVDAKFRIGGIDHEALTPNLQAIQTTWHLEPVDPSVYFTWDVSVWDGTDVWAF